MSDNVFFQLFIFLDVFFIGVMSVIAFQHAMAHFRPQKPSKELPDVQAQHVHLPREIKERLLQASQANFQSVLRRSADELEKDLDTTGANLNVALQKLGGEIVGNELERYRLHLVDIRERSKLAIEDAKAQIDTHQAELEAMIAQEATAMKAELAQEVATEKQKLIKQIDTKLADAVASFLLDTLQYEVDLGAQQPYLLATLEAHKAELTREVADEASVAK